MTLNGLVVANQADGHAEVVLKDDLGQNVAKVPNGELLTVLQNGSGTAKVRWNNVEGWAKAANLKASPPVPPTNAPAPESSLPPTNVPTPEPSRVCENGHHMKESANFCPQCGRRPLQAPQPLPVPTPEPSRVCENGHHMNESANFCPQCGRRPRQAPQALPVPTPEPSRVCENGHHMNESANFCQQCGRRPRQASPQALLAQVPPLVNGGEADAPKLRESITDLRRRALSSGATEAETDGALEQASAHEALISLIKLKQEELLASMSTRTLRDLKKRAREMGVGQDTVDETDDQDDPKQAVIRLIFAKIAAHPAPAPAPALAAHDAAVAAMPTCVICRRPTQGGFRHCCRTCESSQGRSHGPRCKASHAAANLPLDASPPANRAAAALP